MAGISLVASTTPREVASQARGYAAQAEWSCGYRCGELNPLASHTRAPGSRSKNTITLITDNHKLL
jgi:hypothetical protein